MIVNKSKEEKQSFLNLRPLAFAAVAFAAGVCFCFGTIYCGLPFLTAFLSLPVAALPICFSARKRLAVICFFVFLLFLGLGMGGFALQIDRFESQPLEEGKYSLTGRVCSVSQGGEYSLLLLENVSVDGAETEGRMSVYVYTFDSEYTCGDKVRLTASVGRAGRAYRYHTFQADAVVRDIRYSARAIESPVIVKSSSNPFGIINRAIRDTFDGRLSSENAGLAYALTTGNTDGVEEGLLSSVRYGGVAHLFAVSGLHVGAVYLALSRLFKRTKLPVWARVFFPASVSLLFCGVCGCSVSSMRAFLILAATETTKAFGFRADGIELTAFACICLSLFSPAQIFSVGFLLSVSAYAGAALLSPALTRRMNSLLKGACPQQKGISKFLSKAFLPLSVTLCAQVCVLPVSLCFFGYASVWGFFLNLILLPLFAILFPLLLACALLACLLPFAAGIFLLLPSLALSLFSAFFYLCDFSGALLCGFTLSALGAAGIYLLLTLTGGRLNLKNYNIARIPLCGALTAAILFDCIAFGTAAADDCRVTHMCYYENFCAALVECGGEHVLLVNDSPPENRMRTFLYRCAVDPTAVVIVSEEPAKCLNGLVKFSFGDIYVREEFTSGLQTHTTYAGREFSIGEIDFSFTAADRLVFSVEGVVFSFNGAEEGVDVTLFSAEARDGLIFKVNDGILSVY